MPELPEVETTLRGISPHILDQTITEVIVRKSRLRWPMPMNLKDILLGQPIQQITRRAKYLLFTMQHGTLIVHLGMSGHLRILPIMTPPNKHDHLDIHFDHQKLLRFTDPRRFGAVLWTTEAPCKHFLLKDLGVEPLSTQFSSGYLYSRTQHKTLSIKAMLMDVHIVTGIGNIYATEALFNAGLHPARSAKSLTLAEAEKLTKAIKQILRHAIQRGGTTLKDFLKSDGKPGYFSNQLQVYGRGGDACLTCKTPLQSIQLAQRNTVFCPTCQL